MKKQEKKELTCKAVLFIDVMLHDLDRVKNELWNTFKSDEDSLIVYGVSSEGAPVLKRVIYLELKEESVEDVLKFCDAASRVGLIGNYRSMEISQAFVVETDKTYEVYRETHG